MDLWKEIKTSLDFNYVEHCFDLLQFTYNFKTKGFSNLDRFVTTLTLTSNFLTLRLILKQNYVTVTTQKMTMDFDFSTM